MFDQRIYINLKMEALHAFYGASKEQFEEVSYLQHPHRHIFGFTVELKVTHDDRDVEFIMFKHTIEEYLKGKYYSEKLKMCDFTGKSCEMLGKELIEFCLMQGLQPTSVIVDEDGENGAKVIYTPESKPVKAPEDNDKGYVQMSLPLEFGDEPKKDAKVILVVGYTGSGKSTVSNLLKNVTGLELVDVSGLIREINGNKKYTKSFEDRVALAGSVSSSELAVELDEFINVEQGKSVIISGLRDYETYKMLVEKYGREKFYVVKVHTIPQVCAERLGMSLINYMDTCSIDMALKLTSIMKDADYEYKNF